MALEDDLLLRLLNMPTTSTAAWMVVLRTQASPKAGLEGINTGSFAWWTENTTTTGTVWTANALTNKYEAYRYPESSIDKWRIQWPLSDGSAIDWSTTGGTGGDDNATNHIAVVRDGTSLVLYVNGSSADSTTVASTNNESQGTANFNIGSNAGLAVSDFVAWSRAITATEVADLYAAGQGGWPSSGGGILRHPGMLGGMVG